MEITEVRVKLVEDSQDRLLAFCSITLDSSFVIRDLKIIQGTSGPFVAMPSRKLTDRCRHCGGKNALRSHYCNQCGMELDEDRAFREQEGRAKLYADIAHPINSACREAIQKRVLEAFEQEKIAAASPGYVCRYDDYGENSNSLDDDYDDAPAPEAYPRRRVEGRTAAPQQPHRQPTKGRHPVARKSSRDLDFGEGID